MSWECEHCLKTFKTERAFMNHDCLPKQKYELSKTVEGQAAYNIYVEWMQSYNRKAPDMETFLSSRYFNTFISFVRFLKFIGLSNNYKTYMNMMIKRDISPMLWERSECYQLYLDALDKEVHPMKNVEISIDTLLKCSEVLEINVGDVFTKMKFTELFHFIQTRKLSPWLLLCSKKFKQFLSKLDQNEYTELMRLIVPEIWAERLANNRDVVEEIKLVVKELEL